MLCAISGEIPEEPVVSKKSGLLFEKRLIEKALVATGGKCPQTGDDLSPSDLIAVKTTGKHARPTTSSAASFPGLLANLQSEWDALMLEIHSLRKIASKSKQELAHALYRLDSATRVVARLSEERAELRKALLESEAPSAVPSRPSSSARPPKRPLSGPNGDVNGSHAEGADAAGLNAEDAKESDAIAPRAKRHKEATTDDKEKPASPAPHAAEVNPAKPKLLSDDILKGIDAEGVKLRTKRKGRKTPAGLAKASDLSKYAETAECIAATNTRATYFLGLAEGRVLVGYENGKASVLKADTLEEVENRDLKHIEGGVTALVGTGNDGSFVSGGRDGVVRVWGSEPGPTKYVSDPGAAVAGLAAHPYGSLVLSVLEDGRWAWRDVSVWTVLSAHSGTAGLASCAVHPDGALFATGGATGGVTMWDVRTMGAIREFAAPEGCAGQAATSLAMSENGYTLAAGVGGTVAFWDLRKQKIAKQLSADANGGPLAVALDASGSFAAAGTTRRHAVLSAKKRGGLLAEADYPTPPRARAPGDAPWRPAVWWDADARALLTAHSSGAVHRYALPVGAAQ